METIHHRSRFLNNVTVSGRGPVVYWMDRDMRIQDNWALVQALDIAQKAKVPCVIVYSLVGRFLGGSYRQFAFKRGALEELALLCQKKNIPFYILFDEKGDSTAKSIIEFCKKHSAHTLVTDFSPLHIARRWRESVAKRVECPFIEVDTHNIVPVWITSQKQEFAASSIRPKIYRNIGEYLCQFPMLRSQKLSYSFKEKPSIDWESISKKVQQQSHAHPVTWIAPGEKAAHRMLDIFISKKLSSYARDRNNPAIDGQSDLSPYLHYGMISAQRIALECCAWAGVPIENIMHMRKNKASGEDVGRSLSKKDQVAAFLEELIVRRELADNFCFYNSAYDSFEGFPLWAQKTLLSHTSDKREYVYTRKQFEKAETHDDLWNAAQNEMLKKGKMHGYMRMYWAKKILEWSQTPQEALQTALYLNDAYELDGRDPNGYAGIAWSIGGVHDRPWFKRPIFGLVRYMARSGCEKKFDTTAYRDYVQKL